MGTFLPNGYGLWKVTLTLDGSTKIFQTAWMFKNDTSSSAGTANVAVSNYWIAAGRPLVPANVYVGYTVATTETYVMLGGVLTYDLITQAQAGTKSGSNGTPINTSIIVKKDTGIVGKRYRGRSMLPNVTLAESGISQAGIIDSGSLTAIQTQYSGLFTAWNAGSYPPVLGHSSSEVLPTPIISLTVNPKVGTMAHRIRGF